MVFVAAAAWTVAVAITGGFLVRLGNLRLSSRDPLDAALVALLSGAGLLALRRVPSSRTSLTDEWTWWRGATVAILRRGRYLFVPTVLIAVTVAALNVTEWLRAQPLWVDEEMIALNIRDRGFPYLAGPLWLGQSAPLGWLLVQRTILLMFGPAETSLRLFPLMFGLATLGAAVWIGARWLTRVSAVLLLLLCSFGQWLAFYRYELKHYSADAFWGLLLPALAAWAVEGRAAEAHARWIRWWIVAAVAHWFANGALLATPSCAVILLVVILRREGSRAAVRFALAGLIWAVSLGAHYALSLQYTANSRFLHAYWGNDMLPSAAGLLAALSWIVVRLGILANNPIGSGLPLAFWMCAILGFIFSRRPLGALYGALPVMAFTLAAMRLVPVQERLALWIVPSLYVGIALLLDAAIRAGLAGWREVRGPQTVLAAVVCALVLQVSGDVVFRGSPNFDFSPRHSNRGVDDRRAVRWLMERRRPGDALLSTRLGWPAIWWYGGIPLHPVPRRGQLPDGSVMFEVTHERERQGCTEALREMLAGHRRVLLHVGFPDMPNGFYELALHELSRFGSVVEMRGFADRSLVAAIELPPVATGAGDLPPADPRFPPPLRGCVAMSVARRW